METVRFVHGINPVFLELWGIKFWYYGLAYALGFLGIHLWVLRKREQLHLTIEEVWNLSLIFTTSCLFIGRFFEVIFYEWNYYSVHPNEILKFWQGGMATHGVLLGGALGIALFCLLFKKNFLQIADEIVIPTAFFMGLGRIGNHINGEIYGQVTQLWWAVKFPYAEGLRHPVAIYDAIKNFLIIPILMRIKRKSYTQEGILLAHFIFWYSFLRLFVEFFRGYRVSVLGIGMGQYHNLSMATVGLLLIIYFSKSKSIPKKIVNTGSLKRENEITFGSRRKIVFKVVLFIPLIFISMTISSGWSLNRLKDTKIQAPSEKHKNIDATNR